MGVSQSKPVGASPPPCAAAQQSGASACPIKDGEYQGPPVYNVYSQRIDPGASSGVNPRNHMPNMSQLPAPGQRELLSTERVTSSIPKGGTESTWVYPSPQMFYNALRRKGKDSGLVESGDGSDGSKNMHSVMNHVVHTHNTMNEMTWHRIMRWERLHPEGAECRLNRFIGRPDELSPIARFRQMVTGERPFDRHDWYILRNGREVRYVIDYYFADELAGRPDAFQIVERPALDSFESALDRMKMAIYVQCARWQLPCPITGEAGQVAGGQSSGEETAARQS